MQKKKILLIILLAFVLLLIGAYVLYQQLGKNYTPEQSTTQNNSTTQDSTEKEKYPAPDFTVYTLEGDAVKLSDYFGQPIVLNFWASWCGPCQSEMPDFAAAWAEQGEEIQFLMVNMTDGSRETLDSATEFLTEQGYPFPVLYDTASSAAEAYYVYSLPSTYFIDAEGYLIAKTSGAIDAETLQTGIDMISPQ